MKRRDFIRGLLSTGIVCGTGVLPGFVKTAIAAGVSNAFPPLNNMVFVNVMLAGAPDLRFLMPPAFNSDPSSYGYTHWQAKANAHNLGANSAEWQARWENEYFHLKDGNTQFGLLKKATWLKKMWDQGNLAIVNNVVGGQDRNHAHCQMQQNLGDSQAHGSERPGWGGKLVSVSGGNVVSLTAAPEDFCFSPDGDNWAKRSNDNMITAANTRQMGLFKPEVGKENYRQARVQRSMAGYYQAKNNELADTSSYRRFVDQEAEARYFGTLIDERLADSPVPSGITDLYTEDSPVELADSNLGEQVRNLHDCLLCNDILDMKVASMKIGGWDTHTNQKNRLDGLLTDLFGEGRAFDALLNSLPTDVSDKMTFMFAGEFGRQLQANGDGGTDHGRGTSYLVVGKNVRGGIYGDMYPETEIAKLTQTSSDIEGKTEFEHVMSKIADWVQPGASNVVFPNKDQLMLESGVDLSDLMT